MDSISVNDIPQDWQALLGNYFETPEWENLKANLQKEFNLHLSLIRPEPENFFKALTLTPLDQVKVVIRVMRVGRTLRKGS